MKKIGIILVVFFVGLTLKAQETNNIDTYKVAFYSKDATGVFKEMTGKVTNFDVAKSDSVLGLQFDLKIKVASINTGNGVQNKHAKSSEWFNAEKFPTINFVSSSVYKTEKGIFAKGKLSIRGVNKDVVIPIEIKSTELKTIYKAQFSVNRMKYRLGPDNKVSRNIKIIAGVSVKK
ncbi:YceI family protein [Crocinitomicaceae bacterium]|nr:YceI family protein [Crocinitomicaceae bacterium]